jgi:hypothetical protein
MTLQASGQIAISQANVELGVAANTPRAMSELRTLSGAAVGMVAMSYLYGKSASSPSPTPTPGPSPGPGPTPTPAPTLYNSTMVPGFVNDGNETGNYYSGFFTVIGMGSLSPTTFPGATDILGIFYHKNFSADSVTLYTSGSHSQFSAFTVLNLNGTLFYPDDANWSHPGDNQTLWIWQNRVYNFTTGAATAISITGV